MGKITVAKRINNRFEFEYENGDVTIYLLVNDSIIGCEKPSANELAVLNGFGIIYDEFAPIDEFWN